MNTKFDMKQRVRVTIDGKVYVGRIIGIAVGETGERYHVMSDERTTLISIDDACIEALPAPRVGDRIRVTIEAEVREIYLPAVNKESSVVVQHKGRWYNFRVEDCEVIK